MWGPDPSSPSGHSRGGATPLNLPWPVHPPLAAAHRPCQIHPGSPLPSPPALSPHTDGDGPAPGPLHLVLSLWKMLSPPPPCLKPPHATATLESYKNPNTCMFTPSSPRSTGTPRGQTFAASALNVKAEHTQGCDSLPLPFWRVTDHV